MPSFHLFIFYHSLKKLSSSLSVKKDKHFTFSPSLTVHTLMTRLSIIHRYNTHFRYRECGLLLLWIASPYCRLSGITTQQVPSVLGWTVDGRIPRKRRPPVILSQPDSLVPNSIGLQILTGARSYVNQAEQLNYSVPLWPRVTLKCLYLTLTTRKISVCLFCLAHLSRITGPHHCSKRSHWPQT